MKIKSLYIHIPFCLRKCNYCDFVSYAESGFSQLRADYPSLLIEELALYRQQGADLSHLQTIYFGGGTPSLLSAAEITLILESLPAAAEITLEANPETLSPDSLQGYLSAGVNRLSLGVQSFCPQLLSEMGRGHSSQQSLESIAWAQKAGFDNIGLDLIYGLPGQTLAQWQADLVQALALGLQHISLYGLSVEADTPWGKMQAAGELVPIDDDLAADMFELALELLPAAGFCHYEISNFALDGYQSRHNLAYWQRHNYLGLGVAAAGCVLNHRIYNEKDPLAYSQRVSKGELPIAEEEFLTIDQVIAEAVFLGLRMREGIDFFAFRRQYGIDPGIRFRKEISRMVDKGLLMVDERGMRLSQRGLLLGNEVFRAFV